MHTKNNHRKQQYDKSLLVGKFPYLRNNSYSINIFTLIDELGGSYARNLSIHLETRDPDEIYKWLLAAVLYGAPISEKIATRTWHELERKDILTLDRVINTDWNELVIILDQGGYVHYDHKTATKLLDISNALLKNYEGNLNTLHTISTNSDDLEKRIKDLGKGIGNVTANIFLRELRGRWPKANPPLSPLAINAAHSLGYLPDSIGSDPRIALTYLQNLWANNHMTAESFPDFEAALIRKGKFLRHCTA